MKSSIGCRCVLAGVLSILALSLGGASESRADGEDPESLIHQGVLLRKKGEDAKALGYFRRAYEIARAPRTAAQLGLVQLALGNFLEAEIHLSEAVSVTDPWVETYRASLESARAKARTHLCKLEVQGAPPDAVVEATGRPASKLASDGAIWVSPGAVQLRIEAPGFQSATRAVSAVPGRDARVSVTMARLEPEHPPTGGEVRAPRESNPESASASRVGDKRLTGLIASGGDDGRADEDLKRRHHRFRVASVIGAGVGVAAGVTGFVLRNVATQKLNAIKRDAAAPNDYNPSNGNWSRYETTGVGLMIGGGATVAASLLTYLLNRDGPRSTTRESTTVSFAAASGQWGLMVAGHY